ncbi:hypothetical protein MUN89_18255 [Halobacillus salinarum]|uniref:Uncharacterized protein n=1 Tax=Halobacillus salinarum TaxID=2932257 RepID=A0ABY4EI57_9BACI|nr:hypothetical protein [Halobacillus salinarum]UOQ43801.1 hypothetical protein MUN89_18255 [Halobacillus salinarum]
MILCSDEKNHQKCQECSAHKEDGFVKEAAKEANKFVSNTVDTSGKVIKSVTGEGGLIGKTVDSSGKIVKKASEKGTEAIGKTVDTSSKVFKHLSQKAFQRNKEDNSNK